MADYNKKTVVELKLLLKEKALPVSGKKAELIERLQAAEEGSYTKPETTGQDSQTNGDNIIAFYGEKGPYAGFSNWYRSEFITQDPKMSKPSQFYSTEQYLMWRKAKLFGDKEMADKILNAVVSVDNGKEWRKEMMVVKKLGRQVANFNEEIWTQNREQIMRDGLLLKFSQNTELKELLISTGDKIIVEAAPRDRIWGVGVGKEKATNPKNWRGLNLLGKSLEKVRNCLGEQK